MLTWLAFAQHFNSLGKLNIAIDKVLEADSKLIHRYIKILTLSFFWIVFPSVLESAFFFIWSVHNLNADKYSEFLMLLLPLCVSAQSLKSSMTLCYSVDCSPPGSSIYGIIQARILEWVAMPSCRRILLIQGWNPHLLYCQWVLFCWATWVISFC